MPPVNAAPAPAHAGIPAPAQITALQQVREYPAVSVLLSTTPAAELTHTDALRLDALAASAVDRLYDELQTAAALPAVGEPLVGARPDGSAPTDRDKPDRPA